MHDRTRFDLSDGMDLAGVGVRDIWWRYAALGGRADADVLAARIAGTADCTDLEHDLIAQVLNEVFYDNDLKSFPVGYRDTLVKLPPPVRVELSALEAGSARWRAAEARLRSAEAARTAAELHLSAAKLMQASGQLRLARRAHVRAFAAFTRSRAQSIRV